MSEVVFAQINLYDARLRKESDAWTLRNAMLALALCVLIMGSWAVWVQLNKNRLLIESTQIGAQLQEAKAELKRFADQLAAYQPDTRIQDQLSLAKAKLAARSEVMDILKQGLAPGAIKPADVMRGFGTRVPQGLWLTGFRLNKDDNLLEISGRTTDPALIPSYAKQLGEEKAFAGRTFAALTINDAKGTGGKEEEGKPAPVFHEFRLSSVVDESEGAAVKEKMLYDFQSGKVVEQETKR